jgi:hypothetical protein
LNYLGGCEDSTNARVKRMFGGKIRDWDAFEVEKQAFLNRIVKDKNYFRSADDLERFSNAKDSNFTITSPKTCIVESAPFLVLNTLFDTLIREMNYEEPFDNTTINSYNS